MDPTPALPFEGSHGDFASQLKDEDLPYLMDLGTGAKTLMVALAGISGAFGIYAFEFFNITRQFDTDKIFVRDLSQSWYHEGMRGITASLPETAAFLRQAIAEHRYERVVFLGNSMGGYAAIALGVLAGADAILAFAPQTFIDAANRSRHRDNRWPQQIAAIPQQTEAHLLNLKLLLASHPSDVTIDVFYAADERIDREHALHLASCPNVRLHGYAEGGHMLVQHMKKCGDLYRVLRNAFGTPLDDRLIATWKDSAALGIDAALLRHEVDREQFDAFVARHGDLATVQQGLLLKFFAALDALLPACFGLPCVNHRVAAHCHSPNNCRQWFATPKRQFFGSFFALSRRDFLLHVEVGTRNLHVGVVKCRLGSDGRYSILPMEDADYADASARYGAGLPPRIKLARRDWGPRWYSVDCGHFDDPEMFGTYRAMTDLPRSPLYQDIIAPAVELLRSR